MITSTNYLRNISDIARFLTDTEDGGFLFAVVKHQGIIPEINRTVISMGRNKDKKIHTFRAKSRSDRTYTAQVTHASEKADALIFNNLDEFIVSKPEEHLLTKLNFSRETLYALRTPMLFWVHENNLQSIHNNFADVYSQRALANIYFDDIPETDAGDELDQYFGETYLNTEEYKRVQLRINLLTRQLEDAEKTNYPPLRIANDIAISLIDAYADIQVYEPAYDLLKKYKTYFKNTSSNLLTQGRVYRHFNEYDEALSMYQQAAERYNDVRARNAMANLLMLKRDYASARNIYEETVNQFPNDVVSRTGFAEVLKKQGDYESARNIYEEAVNQFPNDVVARNGLAEILKKQGDYTAARTIYEQTVNQFPNDAVARTGLAELLKKQGDYTAARNIYEEAIELFPNNAVARNGLAEVLKKQGDYTTARNIYEQAVKRFPNDAVARNGLAEILKKQGDYTGAKNIYEQTVKRFPNDVVSRNGLAELLKKQGDYTAARTIYEETVKQFPNDVVAKTGLAHVLIELNEYNEALKLFEEVLSINPKDKYAKNGKKRALRLIQKCDQSTQK